MLKAIFGTTSQPSQSSNVGPVVNENLGSLMDAIRDHMSRLEQQASLRKQLANATKQVEASWAKVVNGYAVVDALLLDPGSE